MERHISLAAIRDVAVLFPGDLHELATFLLKARDARDREANAQNPRTIQKSRPTLHGLAAHYSQVTDISRDHVERMLVEAGFDLGAVVEFDPADSANAVGQHPLK
ncbi:MAG: hypothetical protein A2W31_16145 [Planctomycetes bacterium RBG_16_64_10]|nr:MAG: hypothetical protein A2W31_16145 [Planctomycetes bacterium RBG_16_64_10]